MTRTDPRTLLQLRLEDVEHRLGLVEHEQREPGDEGDLATAIHRADITVDGARRLREIERRIHAALARLDAGTYGKCLDCGRAIPGPRLRVTPEAETCIPCQGAREEHTRSTSTRVPRLSFGTLEGQ